MSDRPTSLEQMLHGSLTPLNNDNHNTPYQPHHDEPYEYDFSFHGTGTEYFKIWIVNLILTIITLGIYSPWAKVRRLRYFYGNTELNGETFDFTANPKRILLGRVIALSIYMLISAIGTFMPALGVVGGILMFALFPWLMRSTLRFRARNSQYKNVRFAFMGSLIGAYLIAALAFLLSAIGGIFLWLGQVLGLSEATVILAVFVTFALLAPVGWRLFKGYQFDNTHFGEMNFKLHATMPEVYKAIFIPILIMLGVVMIGTIIGALGIASGTNAGAGMSILIFFGIYLAILFIMPLTQACLHKVIWENLTVGDSGFVLNDFSVFRFAFIQFTNFLLIGLTLGLFMPWAAVRLHRYKTETLALITEEDFEALVTPQMIEESALAEEISDVFDLDVSW